MLVRPIYGRLLVSMTVLTACEDTPRRAPSPDASSAPSTPPPPAREGCARSGFMDAIETDPSCVVKRANEEVTRAALKHLVITLDAEPSEVVAGGTALLALTIKNTSSSEVTLFLEARHRPPGPRTDWSRVAGIPEPHPTGTEIPRLLFPITTTDGDGRDVDAVPTLPGTASAAAVPVPTVLAVHLRPNAKLTRAMSWWALHIPAPPPIVKLDGGHRYVPKTTALNLLPGEYNVTLDLPLFGLGREERKIATRIRVTRAPLPDGGLRKLY